MLGLLRRSAAQSLSARGRARRWSAGLATVAAVAINVTVATPASAATNPYTAKGICGSSYTVPVHTLSLYGYGKVHLLYSPSTGYNCAVTLKTAYLGQSTETDVFMVRQSTPSEIKYDAGQYRYYAGPVKYYARGTCVKFGGSVDDWDAESVWVGCR